MTKFLQESTLSQLIGHTPQGQWLVKWLHQHHKLSNVAEYGLVTRRTDRVRWEHFKVSPDHFLIVISPTAAMAIKPNQASVAQAQARLAASGRRLGVDGATDRNIVYDMVAFSQQGDRIDNQLVPYPSFKDFGLPSDDYDTLKNNPKVTKLEQKWSEYQAAIEQVERDHDRTLPPGAALTQISSTRGGLPFQRDPHQRPHTLLDQIRDVLGGPFSIYTAVSHVGGIQGRDAKALATSYGQGQPAEVSPAGIQGLFGAPTRGTREPGAIERGKLAGRSELRKPQHFDAIVTRLKPLIMRRLENINDHIAAARRGASADQIKQFRDQVNRLDNIEIALTTATKFDPTDRQDAAVRLVVDAIEQVGGVDLASDQGQAYLAQLAEPGNIAKLKPVLAAVSRELSGV